MGLSSQEVDKMTIWELGMVAAGYAASQGTEMDSMLSEDEIDALGDWISK